MEQFADLKGKIRALIESLSLKPLDVDSRVEYLERGEKVVATEFDGAHVVFFRLEELAGNDPDRFIVLADEFERVTRHE